MIERLLAADRALEAGDLELASRLFGQVADADPRNAMAVVGRARIALARSDPGEARRLANDALLIDPDDAAARRLLEDLDAPVAPTTQQPSPAEPPSPVESSPAGPRSPGQPSPATGPPRRGLVAWLRRLFGRRG